MGVEFRFTSCLKVLGVRWQPAFFSERLAWKDPNGLDGSCKVEVAKWEVQDHDSIWIVPGDNLIESSNGLYG